MKDARSRKIEYLRVSVTDRCNFRCIYCMPEEGIEAITHEEVLSFEEIVAVCRIMAQLGIQKVKLTGGEPLVRKNFIELVKDIKAIPGIEEITLTTNGLLLADQLEDLVAAGISAINISLDTLDHERFKQITRVDGLEKVVEAIHKAADCKALRLVKINALIAKGLNEEDILGLAAFAKDKPIHVRFIELMPIGIGRNLKGMTKEEIMNVLEKVYGPLESYHQRLGNGPSTYYTLPGFKGKIGFISAVSECFCEDCNRVRLTSDGFLKLCLHSTKGIDLKSLLRKGIKEEEIKQIIEKTIEGKPEKHHFGERDAAETEQKIMAQIGG